MIRTHLNNVFCLFLIIWVGFLLGACSFYKTPVGIKETPPENRIQIKEEEGVRVSVAILTIDEAKEIFGIDLSRKKIEALWLEVENNSVHSLLYLPTATDPDYFPPLEVSYAFHKSFAGDRNDALDEHLMRLHFPIRKPIEPASRVSGYIFINASQRMRAIDIDLIGSNVNRNLTFFVPDPELPPGSNLNEHLAAVRKRMQPEEALTEDELRHLLEKLPANVLGEEESEPLEPMNLVIIGKLEDWITAFVRRGYRYQDLTPRYAFGRTQEISARKRSRGYTKARAHTLRLWLAPIRYKGTSVWVGQTSLRLGGRFSKKINRKKTLPMDPYVDDARDDIVQDLAYSQALMKTGHVKGAGKGNKPASDASATGLHYRTDGLRAVLVFGDRPASLATIEFFDWERLSDYR